MSEPLLNVKNLSVDVEEKSILHGINLTINNGESEILSAETRTELYKKQKASVLACRRGASRLCETGDEV